MVGGHQLHRLYVYIPPFGCRKHVIGCQSHRHAVPGLLGVVNPKVSNPEPSTGYWGLSPEAWAVLMTFPMFWPLFMFASFNAGILQKPPKKENRRLPAQRHGLMMKWRQRPKHATESEEDYDALPKSAMSNVEAFVLFQIAPVTKFVRHSIFYFIFVIFMSYDLLSATLVSDGPRMENAASSDPGKGPFTWIRILVISNAVAINVHQYTRIYQVRNAIRGLIVWCLCRHSRTPVSEGQQM